jgi:predicted MFS family arabinose efflux permease
VAEGGDDSLGLGVVMGLGAIVLATFLAVTTEIVPVGLLPQLSRAFDVSPGVAGLLVTVYAALVVVLAVPLTRITVRWPRKPMILATIALYCVGNLVIALAPSFAVVCAGRVIGGIAHALFFSVANAAASALVPRRLQGRALAIAASGASLGYVLGVPLVTSIGSALDWRAAFGALAVGGLLIGLVASAALPAIPPSAPPVESERRPKGALIGAAGVDALAFFGHYALYTYVSALLLEAGVPEVALGAALFLFGAAGIAGVCMAGLVIDRRPRVGFVLTLALATICTGLLLLVRGWVGGTVGASTLWLVGFGAIPVFCTAACLRTDVISTDLASAVNNSASNLGIGLGAAVGGVVFSAAGTTGVIVVATLSFAAAAVLVLVLRVSFPSRPTPLG